MNRPPLPLALGWLAVGGFTGLALCFGLAGETGWAIGSGLCAAVHFALMLDN